MRDKPGSTVSYKRSMSLATITTLLVVAVVLLTTVMGLTVFLSVYENSMRLNAVTSSEQAVVQVSNTVRNYIDDMKEVMTLIKQSYDKDQVSRTNAINTLVEIRSDVVAISCYDEADQMTECFSGRYQLKNKILKNLSYEKGDAVKEEDITISQPHAETLLLNYYPWVVSIMQELTTRDGGKNKVVIDIRFSKIANYIDAVGIGQHGYCFIMDGEGQIIYHPQQQLIYSGLKEENTKRFDGMENGTLWDNQAIYTVNTLNNYNWRIVGVSYIDELVTARKTQVVGILSGMLAIVVAAALISSYVLSRKISKPIQSLVNAMAEFEKNAENFTYEDVGGSSEIASLSQSFDQMVLKIQALMEKVRNEEISLRKTELKALQAQINPHFLYNTLDAIGWLCEEERSQDAVEMVNALARLFRISISKGHELIPIQKEVEHAGSYLKIQNFRYKNQFTYHFDVEESCLPYYCNKITLQPIIENAIYHGIDRMVDEGKIEITIREQGEDILFSIRDNGVGMTREQCAAVLNKEPGDQTGIGIKNVNDRIKIYFGEKYGIQIESELDEGTCVTICMPKVREGDYEER